MLVATKPVRVVTLPIRLPLITPHDPSVTWSCEVRRQTKYAVSPDALDQWTPNNTRWQLTVGFSTFTSNLLYHTVYGHQTYQSGICRFIYLFIYLLIYSFNPLFKLESTL